MGMCNRWSLLEVPEVAKSVKARGNHQKSVKASSFERFGNLLYHLYMYLWYLHLLHISWMQISILYKILWDFHVSYIKKGQTFLVSLGI